MIEATEINSTFYALRLLAHGLDTSQIEVTDGEEYPASEFTTEEQEQALKIIHNIEASELVSSGQLPQNKIDFYVVALAERIEELANSDLANAGYAVESIAGRRYLFREMEETPHFARSARGPVSMEERAISDREIGQKPAPELDSTTETSLNDVDPYKRAAAVTDLARSEGKDAFSLIAKCFDDPSPHVRNAAARAFWLMEPTQPTDFFNRALEEGSDERRQNIGHAIAASGLANEAINNLANESREDTYNALSILFVMAKTGEVELLVSAQEMHPNLEVRKAVAKLLNLSGHQTESEVRSSS